MAEQAAKELAEQAYSLMESNRLQEARALYERLCAMNPSDDEAWFMRGVLSSELGDLGQAVGNLQRAVELRPAHAEAHYSLASIWRAQGQVAEALESCQRAVNFDADFTDAWLMLCGLQGGKGRYSEAEKSCRRVIELQPDNLVAHLNLASALQAQNNYSEAIAVYRETLKLQPDNAQAHGSLGLLLRHVGRIDEAVQACNQAIRVSPGLAEPRRCLGLVCLEQGKFKDAIPTLQQALTIKPDDPLALNGLGQAYQATGRLEDAQACYRKAIELQPDHKDTHYNLGVLLQALGDIEQAIECYRHVLQLDPDHTAAHHNLSILLSGRDEMDEALKHCLQALRKNPDTLAYQQNLVQLLGLAADIQPNEELREQILGCFRVKGVDLQSLAKPVLAILKRDPKLSEVIQLANNGDYQALKERALDARLSTVLQDELLHALLLNTTIADIEFEHLLTALRKLCLEMVVEDKGAGEITLFDTESRFVSALACQCFHNEYVYPASSEELDKLGDLQSLLNAQFATGGAGDNQFKLQLAIFGMYRPLYVLDAGKWVSKIDFGNMTPIQLLIKRQWSDHREETEIRGQISALTAIKNDTSLAVQEEYDVSPYPRWSSVGLYSPKPYRIALQQMFPHFSPPDFGEGPLEILVAGCGTGSHALIAATRFANAQVLGIDLSLNSLAYAKRKASELNIANAAFQQGDILELGSEKERFHLVEVGGVLHNLDNPRLGVQILAGSLQPGGIISIGLYSKTAQRSIQAARAYVRDSGIELSPEGIRQAREAIIQLNDDHPAKKVAKSKDFYTLSESRFLLFEIHEKLFQLSEMDEVLKETGLEVIGFELHNPKLIDEYKKLNPDDLDMKNLANLQAFENQYSDYFPGMYLLWCQRRPTSRVPGSE